jgi:hypothetical protein
VLINWNFTCHFCLFEGTIVSKAVAPICLLQYWVGLI